MAVTRKTMLYKTGVEYGDYTMNHVVGCSHGCKYPCYAYLLRKRFGQVKTYGEWVKPQIVTNTMELLEREIPRLKHKIKSVQLCFMTDPFMFGHDEVGDLSMAAIKRLNKDGIKCRTLTKGTLPLELQELNPKNEYGISLISLDERYRERMEPGAAPYAERIAALKALHAAGCKTWVSMEPYPTPNLMEQSLAEILQAISFADRIIFGRTNHNSEISAYKGQKQFYNKCAEEVMGFCREHGIDCYIKAKTITGEKAWG